MNIALFLSFTAVAETTFVEIFYDKRPWRVTLLCILFLFFLVPFLSELFEFFTSPKCKISRIKMGLLKSLFPISYESIYIKRLLNGTHFYCNQFTGHSEECNHHRVITLVDGSSEHISMGDLGDRFFIRPLDKHSELYLRRGGLPLATLDKSIEAGPSNLPFDNSINFRCKYNIKIMGLSMDFILEKRIGGCICIVKAYSSRTGFGKEIYKSECTRDGYFYLVKLYTLIRDSNRYCCAVCSPGFNNKSKRLHFVRIQDVCEGILVKGMKAGYKGQMYHYKVVEGHDPCQSDESPELTGHDILTRGLGMKYGENLSNCIVGYIKKEYGGSLKLLNFCLRSEKGSYKSLGLSNWKNKRFLVDLSYIREKFGFCKMYGIDHSVNPTVCVRKYVESHVKENGDKTDPLLPKPKHAILSESTGIIKKAIKNAAISISYNEFEKVRKKLSALEKSIPLERQHETTSFLKSKKSRLEEKDINDRKCPLYLNEEEKSRFRGLADQKPSFLKNETGRLQFNEVVKKLDGALKNLRSTKKGSKGSSKNSAGGSRSVEVKGPANSLKMAEEICNMTMINLNRSDKMQPKDTTDLNGGWIEVKHGDKNSMLKKNWVSVKPILKLRNRFMKISGGKIDETIDVEKNSVKGSEVKPLKRKKAKWEWGKGGGPHPLNGLKRLSNEENVEDFERTLSSVVTKTVSSIYKRIEKVSLFSKKKKEEDEKKRLQIQVKSSEPVDKTSPPEIPLPVVKASVEREVKSVPDLLPAIPEIGTSEPKAKTSKKGNIIKTKDGREIEMKFVERTDEGLAYYNEDEKYFKVGGIEMFLDKKSGLVHIYKDDKEVSLKDLRKYLRNKFKDSNVQVILTVYRDMVKGKITKFFYEERN